ncbi:hypothetical protein [Thermococcus thermotolerans]|uniref:hypothetical protein n=1 Tax=Thermococcus thermotolerans TaxID=2969672 RepID=UPI0021571A06|nr:hypothetical protein [Thermococcus thermotolerans]
MIQKKILGIITILIVLYSTHTVVATPFGILSKELTQTELEEIGKVISEYRTLISKGGLLNDIRAQLLLIRHGIKKGKTKEYVYSFPRISTKNGEAHILGREEIFLKLEVTPYASYYSPNYVFVEYHWEWTDSMGRPATEEWGWRGSEDLIYIPYPKGMLEVVHVSITTTLGVGDNGGVSYIGEKEETTSTIINGVKTTMTTKTYAVKDEIFKGSMTIMYKIHPNVKGEQLEFGMKYEHTYGNTLFSLLDNPWYNFAAGVISLGLALLAAPAVITYTVTAYTLSSAAESLLDGSWPASAKSYRWTL